ncbi:MAG: CopD family protein, partial [Betaproteobacteria bacterium]
LGLGIGGGWMHAKLVLVLALVTYHGYCGRVLADYRAGRVQRGLVWVRWFNEMPVLLLVAAVLLVVIKPF